MDQYHSSERLRAGPQGLEELGKTRLSLRPPWWYAKVSYAKFVEKESVADLRAAGAFILARLRALDVELWGRLKVPTSA